MHPLHPELTAAMSAMLDKLDAWLRSGGYSGEPVKMFLAGGMALHFHCGARYTEDVDASFSARLLVPSRELTVDYVREDGTPSTLYFDANYNTTFALLHPDFQENAVAWPGIGNERRLVHLYVFSALDLAVSKISRFAAQDRDDILLLAAHDFFSAAQLRTHAVEALDYYVGNTRWVHGTIDLICDDIAHEKENRPAR
jgi:hypothetical protein